jgi:hypothetical protein
MSNIEGSIFNFSAMDIQKMVGKLIWYINRINQPFLNEFLEFKLWWV